MLVLSEPMEGGQLCRTRGKQSGPSECVTGGLRVYPWKPQHFKGQVRNLVPSDAHPVLSGPKVMGKSQSVTGPGASSHTLGQNGDQRSLKEGW